MKINITNIMDGVKDFVKEHKKAIIITTGVVVAGAIAIGVGVGIANSDKDKVDGVDTTINEETTVVDETTGADDTSSDVAVEDGTTVVDDTTAEETTVPESETEVTEPETTVTPDTTVPETEAATKAPETQAPETVAPVTEPNYVETAPDTVIGAPSNDRPKYVQDADPSTGISWDGVSPIIYTYTDGTTGTEPRDGATYEVVPFVTVVYEAPEPVDPNTPVYDGVHCTECGRVEGNGKNGTCVRLLMGELPCRWCGEIVYAGECHTCDDEE